MYHFFSPQIVSSFKTSDVLRCEMVAEFIFTDMYSGAMVFDDVYICNLGGQQAWNNFEIVSRKSRSLLRALG